MQQPETRELAYFVAVAEERHFGRAAQRLGMAQPPLSRAIQQLERRLGVPLLERTSRGVTLTAAGAVFLVESHKALDAVTAAVRRAQRAGEAVPKLLVATKPDGDAGLLERILPRYRQDPDAVEVEVVVCGIGEQTPMLRDGRVDLAFVHPAHDDLAGFDTELLLTQDQVAVLHRDHRLAGRSALVLADLDGEPLPRWPGTDKKTSGPEVRDSGQLMALIALGQAVAVLPASVRRHAWADVVCVPVLDAPQSSIMLAWPDRTRSRAVAAFVRASTEAVSAQIPGGPAAHFGGAGGS
ncbi:LysR family transcriptional regulator [Amycolatopsis sp. WQ 127309]|uniref:LysR family transcriptional regulator n=1 Tax=Amycolatopsis sp. WQ 127309 TaxID=2932773 RepID=UPI001FF25779|nr:LysR family transcriptional regulator [Amycolatopsis sp. WQ 127309]UOZ09993.1 LysR family transcriptional regulator [Amycolatopsis sp. WQ 127309]